MDVPFEKTEKEILNKRKTIELKSENNKQFKVEFINEVNILRIEAKFLNDILIETFSNEFTLQDIKKVRFFNDDYESIDDCLSEIFDKLDRNETKMKMEKDGINIVVPLYSKKYPEIKFFLKKVEKSEEVKCNELYELIKKMKDEQKQEVKALKDRINYLEDLLKIKKKSDIEKTNEDFDGSIVSIKSFGKNEFDKYFDYNLPDKRKIIFAFELSCKDEKDIDLALSSFMGEKNEVYGDSAKDIICRIKNNKLFIYLVGEEILPDLEKRDDNFLFNLFLSIGQSLKIKIKANPNIFTEEFNEEKILKIILDTELEFENMSPQIQLFAYHFLDFIKDIRFNEGFCKLLFTDIFMNVMNGEYKYKIPERLINECKNEDSNPTFEIFKFFKEILGEIIEKVFKIGDFKDYKIIDFDNINFYIVSHLFK